jgi:hypothetical protein
MVAGRRHNLREAKNGQWRKIVSENEKQIAAIRMNGQLLSERVRSYVRDRGGMLTLKPGWVSVG